MPFSINLILILGGVLGMHVENEAQIVVGVVMMSVKIFTKLEMLHSCIVPCNLKVRESQIVLELSVIRFQLTGLLESFQGLRIESLLVEGDA